MYEILHRDNNCNRVWKLIWNGNLSLKLLYTKMLYILWLKLKKTDWMFQSIKSSSHNVDHQSPLFPLKDVVAFAFLYSSLVIYSNPVFLIKSSTEQRVLTWTDTLKVLYNQFSIIYDCWYQRAGLIEKIVHCVCGIRKTNSS